MVGLVYALATFTVAGGDLRVSSLQKGLVGHWALDGESLNNITNRTTDKTPYENHGTVYGAVLTTDQMGQGNRAMSFDGDDDYINCGTGSSLDLGARSFTITTWIKADSVTDPYAGIVTRRGGSGGYYQLSLHTNSNIVFYTHDLTIARQQAKPINLGQWYFVTAIIDRDANLIKLSLDGGTFVTNDITGLGNIGDNSDPVRIGWEKANNAYFNGTISDVRIYNRALSANEIDTLYHSYRPKAASGSLHKGLILDMPLKSKYTKDETVGSEILTDRTPYSNDGQNYGAVVEADYTTFDGVDDYVNCGTDADNFAMGNVDHTFSVWVYPTAVPIPYNYIVAIGNSATGKQSSLGITSASKLFLSAYSSPIVITAYALPSLDCWYHIVMVYIGETDTASFYVNGEWVEDESIILDTTIGKCFISAHTGALSFFTGTISDVRIYNRALSPSEIKLLYDKGR